MGSLDSTAIDRRLAANNPCMLLLMLADSAMHKKNDSLSGHAALAYIPPNDEAKVGATLASLLLEVVFGA